MRKQTIVSLVAVGVMLSASSLWAGQPSVEMGEKLFSNPGLGASPNDTSCASCHPGGEGMAKAADNPQLGAMINRCIQGPLKGEGLSENSAAMESLKLYIKSLGK